jgi:hypothetical protein
MEGRNAARLFPKSSSLSVVGVARSGSRLFSTFSPMKLYAPMTEGRRPASMMKMVNSPPRMLLSVAAGISPGDVEKSMLAGSSTERARGPAIRE